MNPGDRAANIDLVHSHRNAELLERWPVAFPIPLDRRPTDMFVRIFRGCNKNVILGARPKPAPWRVCRAQTVLCNRLGWRP
jgi:hypothetical protein